MCSIVLLLFMSGAGTGGLWLKKVGVCGPVDHGHCSSLQHLRVLVPQGCHTKYRELGAQATEMDCLTALEARSLKCRLRQARFLHRAAGESPGRASVLAFG